MDTLLTVGAAIIEEKEMHNYNEYTHTPITPIIKDREEKKVAEGNNDE